MHALEAHRSTAQPCCNARSKTVRRPCGSERYYHFCGHNNWMPLLGIISPKHFFATATYRLQLAATPPLVRIRLVITGAVPVSSDAERPSSDPRKSGLVTQMKLLPRRASQSGFELPFFPFPTAIAVLVTSLTGEFPLPADFITRLPSPQIPSGLSSCARPETTICDGAIA